MNQTKNRIREEFLEWCKEDPALELANGVGSFENIADWFLPKIDELLKSQRDSLVEKIKEEVEKYEPAYESEDKAIVSFGKQLLSNLSTNKENEK